MKRIIPVILLAIFLAPPCLLAAGKAPVKPSQKDKCPVCGMFVAKYPDFAAQIMFRDGSTAHFDGAKDMFKYFLNMKKYNPAKKQTDVGALHVTDYYSLALIDGQSAFYVTGSDVMGPMGKELIAFGKESDAQEFMKDHKGKSIVRFRQVTGSLVEELD